MRKTARPIRLGAALAAVVLLTGCPSPTQMPKRGAAPASKAPALKSDPSLAILPNTQVNPVITHESQLPDPYVITDTVQLQAPQSVSLQVNPPFQQAVESYMRIKFPQTADVNAVSPPDAPRIILWLTYADIDPRWSVERTFMVVTTLRVKVTVKFHGIHEQELHATGVGRGNKAFQDSVNAAIRASIPEINRYIASLNL